MRLLTPPGIAGVAVVQVEAHERARIGDHLRTASGAPVALTVGAPPRRAQLSLEGAVVDDVLLVDRGSSGLELHLHGSRAVLAALARVFSFAETKVTTPARRLLGEALGASQLELAIEQMAIDFDRYCAEVAALTSDRRTAELAAAGERSRVAMAHVEPVRLVLIGAQNAGKSSLFNRLLFRERAATGAMAGLTRDPVAEVTVLDGYPYELVDTAGEGEVATALDAAAIVRGQQLRIGALQLLVVDGNRGPSAIDRTLAADATLVVANKADLPPAAWPPDLPCHLRASCTAEAALLLRARTGAQLRRHRRLPTAGRVGGAAALSREQLAQLAQAAGVAAIVAARGGRHDRGPR